MNTPSLQELLSAGVHFGHKISRGHPKMRPYIYGAREGVHIIDLTKSEQGLKEACEFAYKLGQEGKVLLFVGTKKQAKPIIEELAKKVSSPYMSTRWVGGFLTNFDEVSKNVKKMKDFKTKKENGELNKYTKKEQLLIDRKVGKLERDLGGVSDLTEIPDALFVVDASHEDVALKEARRINQSSGKQISIIGIADTNCDPSLMDYPIPGNDDAIKSIRILSEAIANSYEAGKKEAGKIKEKADGEVKEKVEVQPEVSEEVLAEVAAVEEQLEKKELEDSERKVE